MAWTCPKCERELKNENQWHNCVRVSLDDLLKGKPDEVLLAFDKLLAEVADWDEVLVSTTANCIVFVHNLTFFIIRPMQKQLDLKFYSATYMQHPQVIKSTLQHGKFENHIRLSNTDELNPQVFGMIRGSYELL